jgi:ribosomal protein S18 acetylase RimI-like enzyme
MTARDAIQIRVGTLADCEAVARLLVAMGYPVEPKSTEERMRELVADSERNLVLVATVGIVVAGVVAGHLIPMLQQEQALGRITALAVDEDQRGLGVGKRLLAAAERWFAERGASRIEVTSAEQREQAHEFFRKAGFREKRLRLVKSRN